MQNLHDLHGGHSKIIDYVIILQAPPVVFLRDHAGISKGVEALHTLETNDSYNIQDRRKKRKQQKAKKRLARLKRFLLFVLLVSTLTGLALSPLFNIVVMEVSGSQHYESEEITGVIDLSVGNNAFKSLIYEYRNFTKLILFRYAKAEERIVQSFPYVKEAKVRYVVPGRIKIDITERTPFAVITGTENDLLVDKEGYVLESAKNMDRNGFVVINGIKFQDAKPGQAVTSNIGESMEVLTRLLKTMEESDASDSFKLVPTIQAVNLADLRNVRLFLDGRVAVNLGDVGGIDNLEYRISFLKQIFFKNIGNKDVGTIDFTIGDKPRFIPGT